MISGLVLVQKGQQGSLFKKNNNFNASALHSENDPNGHYIIIYNIHPEWQQQYCPSCQCIWIENDFLLDGLESIFLHWL